MRPVTLAKNVTKQASVFSTNKEFWNNLDMAFSFIKSLRIKFFLCESKFINFGFLIEEATHKTVRNKEVMCKFFCTFFVM